MRLILGLLASTALICDALLVHKPRNLHSSRSQSLGASESVSDIEALVAEALGKIKTAESELEASVQSRKQYAGKNPLRDEGSSDNNEAPGAASTSSPPKKALPDDSIGFLIDQNKMLNDNDYKTIFDTVAVRGPQS